MPNEKIELVSSEDSPTGVAGRRVNGEFQERGIVPGENKTPTSADPQVLSSDSFANEPQLELPDDPQPSAVEGELGRTEQMVETTEKTLAEQQQAQAAQAGQRANFAEENYLNALVSQTTEAELQDAAQSRGLDAFGGQSVDDLRVEVQDYNNQIRAEQRALQNTIRDMERNERGLFGGALQDKIQDKKTESLRRQADLAILQQAALGKYDIAQDIANRSVDAQLERQKLELDVKKYVLDKNWELFKESDRRAFQAQLQEDDYAFQIKRDKMRELGTEKIRYLQNAIQAGASEEELAAISSCQTLAGLYSTPNLQRYSLSQEEKLQLQELRTSIAANNARLAETNQEDLNATLIQSLLTPGGGKMPFEEFVAQKEQEQGRSIADRESLREEYNALPDTSVQDKNQVLAYLVATGGLKPQQATFLQENLETITSAKEQQRQANVIETGKGVLRDINRAIDLSDAAGGIQGILGERAIKTEAWLTTAIAGQVAAPGAFELSQHLESIKSNISIEELQRMREASPTGGALGQVPVQQQEFLMSVKGSLRASLKPEVLTQNLQDLYNIYLDAMYGAPDELSGAVRNGTMSQSEANHLLRQRKESSYDDFNLPTARSGGEDIGDLIIAPDGSLVRLK